MSHDQKDREAIRARFLTIDTANVSDVLDEMGVQGQALSADFVPRSGERLAGWAYPIQGESRPGGPPTDPLKLKACAGVGPGDVTVWSGDGQGSCYFGELIALGLQSQGCVGALVDGGVRDIAWLDKANFATFSTYRTPVQSIGRWQVRTWGEPVTLPGATGGEVTVNAGDFVLADTDGAIVIPAREVDHVLGRAEAVTLREVEIREALLEGTRLEDVIETFGAI